MPLKRQEIISGTQPLAGAFQTSEIIQGRSTFKPMQWILGWARLGRWFRMISLHRLASHLKLWRSRSLHAICGSSEIRSKLLTIVSRRRKMSCFSHGKITMAPPKTLSPFHYQAPWDLCWESRSNRIASNLCVSACFLFPSPFASQWEVPLGQKTYWAKPRDVYKQNCGVLPSDHSQNLRSMRFCKNDGGLPRPSRQANRNFGIKANHCDYCLSGSSLFYSWGQGKNWEHHGKKCAILHSFCANWCERPQDFSAFAAAVRLLLRFPRTSKHMEKQTERSGLWSIRLWVSSLASTSCFLKLKRDLGYLLFLNAAHPLSYLYSIPFWRRSVRQHSKYETGHHFTQSRINLPFVPPVSVPWG